MPIVGFIVHTLSESSDVVSQKLEDMSEISTYGIHDGCYIVAVAEVSGHRLEALMDTIKNIPDVIACYVTSLHNDDQLD